MFIASAPASEAAERVYQSTVPSLGFVMNLSRVWAWRPDVFEGFATLRAQLTTASTLSKREQAVIVCATAAGRGDSYCALAWGKTLADASDGPTAAAVLKDIASDSLSPRELALSRWARRAVDDPCATTADDVAALRSAGFDEREIVEATIFVAFRLAFSTVNAALGARPDRELVQRAPREVVDAVTYGRPVDA